MKERLSYLLPFRLWLIAIIAGLLPSCTTPLELYPFWAKPASLDIMEAPPGPPIYQQAYRDGCESGWKAYGVNYNQAWWSVKQDASLRNNPLYYQMWKDAYAYCSAWGNTAGMHGLGNYSDTLQAWPNP